MNRLVNYSLVLVCALLLSSSLFGQNSSNRNSPNLLVSPAWLARQIESNTNLRVLDLAFRKTNYESGHIPGAVFLDWRKDIIDTEKSNYYRLPQKREMEKLLSRIGVDKDTTIVLTDNMSNRASVRMYYTLKYFGHRDVRILNGGTGIWKASKKELSKNVPDYKPAQYRISATKEDFLVKLDAVQEAIENDRVQIVDGRPADQYTGKTPGKAFHNNTPHERLGHVPRSINIPWNENLNADGTFKSLEKLEEMYREKGIVPGGETITYCNEGLHAAMPWFILRELMGNQKIRVYDDSMAEWANRDDTPLEKSTGAGRSRKH